VSIVVRFHPANLTAERYDQVVQQLDEAQSPPDGRDYHVCFGSEGNLTVSEIWDSQEQLDAYRERLMPVLAEAGIEMAGEPEVFEVHHIEKR